MKIDKYFIYVNRNTILYNYKMSLEISTIMNGGIGENAESRHANSLHQAFKHFKKIQFDLLEILDMYDRDNDYYLPEPELRKDNEKIMKYFDDCFNKDEDSDDVRLWAFIGLYSDRLSFKLFVEAIKNQLTRERVCLFYLNNYDKDGVCITINNVETVNQMIEDYFK